MDLLPVVVGGAAGAFVKELTQKGVGWLIALVASHNPAVKAKMQANANNFLERLARRVEALEAELPVAQRHVFEDALDHPGTSLLMQKALTTAAATDNDDRHEILSELIAQRLTAGADDQIALTGSAACDVVGALSSRQIHLLGVIAVLYGIRPTETQIIETQDLYDEYVRNWWNSQLDRLCTADLAAVQWIDLAHLVGLSCISLSAISAQLNKTLSLAVKPTPLTASMAQMETFAWWQPLNHVWEAGVKRASPTSTGSLIGVLYHDRVHEVRTAIRWGDVAPA